MTTNKTVFLIGILLIVLGASMLAPYASNNISRGSHSFISASFISIFVGILFILANLEKDFKLNLRQTFLFSSLAWIMVALFGSLPLYYRHKILVLVMHFSKVCLELQLQVLQSFLI